MGSNRIINPGASRKKPKPRRRRPQVELPMLMQVGGGSIAYTGDDSTNLEGTIGLGARPTTFPGLLRWYKADSFTGIASDGDTIGGGVNTREPWRDLSGNLVDSGATTATQTGTTTVTIVGGSFTFAAGDVGKTIQFKSGAGRDALIMAYIGPTQVTVDLAQTFAATGFTLTDNANYAPANGPIFKTNIVGTKPVIRFTGIQCGLNFRPGTLNDFTVIAASAMTTTSGATSSIMLSDLFITGHQLRRHYQVFEFNTMLFYGAAAVIINTNPLEMTTPPASTDFMVTVWRRSGGSVQFRQNQTNKISSVGADALGWSVNQIGTTAGIATEMDMGELLVYNQYLSDADVSRLYTQYLKPRWVTLP